MFFFFFQAEDGIRDLTVTGVQTCALPIFRNSTPRNCPSPPRHPVKRSRPHQPKMFALGPEESGAERTQQPLVASGHQKVGTELVDIHGYCPAALADVQQ